MYLRFKGDLFTASVLKEVRWITDRALLRFAAMEHSKHEAVVSLPIVRCKIRPFRGIFGRISYKYDFSVRIPALVTIRNVIDCVVENNFDDATVCEAHLGPWGFAVDFEKREIGIASIEEAEGRICWSIDLKVSEIDIEIKDQN
jgi:hypothetical protein